MKSVIVFFALLTFSTNGFSQMLGERLTVSKSIGDTLRPATNMRLGLFPATNGFKWAVFFLEGDSLLNVKIHSRVNDSLVVDSTITGYGTLRSLHDALSRRLPGDDDSAKVVLHDGSLLPGIVYGETADRVFLETARFGLVKISRSDIETLARREGERTEGYYRLTNDPNQTRAFLMPTAYTPRAGSGYVGDYELVFFTAAVGVTDWLMLNGGTLLLPLPAEDMIFDYGFKARLYQVEDKFCVAAGLQMVNGMGFKGSAGIAYGIASFGNYDSRLNLAYGRAFENFSKNSVNLFGLSGDLRAGENTKLLAEFWVLENASWSPLVVGVRFFGSKLAADLGLLYPIGVHLGSPIGYPVASLIYSF